MVSDHQETNSRNILKESGKIGMELYPAMMEHINTYYQDQLKCIAFKLHDPNDEPWIGSDLIVHQASMMALDGRGFDIQVTVCKESSCWLSVVHARLPFRAATACELFSAFDDVCETCMCKNNADVSGLSKIHEAIMPEFFQETMNILNHDFLQQINRTLSDLAGLSSDKGEYITNLRVSDVTADGFRTLVNFCNYEKCSTMEVDIAFPRSATDRQDFQDELVECLDEHHHNCVITEAHVTDLEVGWTLEC